MEYEKLKNIQFDGVDERDYPDFVDAHIVYAEIDGVELTEDQLNELNNDEILVHELLMEKHT